MNKFHIINVKTYPQKSLNISKWVVRGKELSLCTIEEIKKRNEETRCNRSKESYNKK